MYLMRSLMLIFAGIALSFTMYAQANIYHPFDSTSRAIIEHYDYGLSTGTNITGSIQSMDRDTVILGKPYKLLEYSSAWNSLTWSGLSTYTNRHGQQHAVVGAIRQDSSKKVYFYSFGDLRNKLYNIYAQSENLDSTFVPFQETLLYDFDLAVGDSILRPITVFWVLDSFYAHVTQIDSILLMDNSYRKRFTLEGYYYNSTELFGDSIKYYLVEGIGVVQDEAPNQGLTPTEGIFGAYYAYLSPNSWEVAYNTTVRCFYEQGVQLLGDTSFCDTVPDILLGIAPLKKESTKITIAPNPFSHQTTLFISGPLQDELFIEIMDVTGKSVQKRKVQGSNEIVIYKNNLVSGVYYYKLWTEEQLIGSGKLVVK
jgi:hypothetical protein